MREVGSSRLFNDLFTLAVAEITLALLNLVVAKQGAENEILLEPSVRIGDEMSEVVVGSFVLASHTYI